MILLPESKKIKIWGEGKFLELLKNVEKCLKLL